ncbi:MAG: hypothetical protein WCT10_02640 [Patescibacteria group bacterium]|jgi:predicted translin family RNA/ssDNA-binding protein
MLDREYLSEVRSQVAVYEASRREVIKSSGDALSASKRAIFALHRDDAAAAAKLLEEAGSGLAAIVKAVGSQLDVSAEGSFRAALEEFVEAELYRRYLATGDVGRVEIENVDYEIYLSGLSDLTGELQRRQVRLATEGKLDEVKRIKELMEAIVAELLDMDLGGYLRNKFDQAKNNLRRAEEVLYELSLRSK